MSKKILIVEDNELNAKLFKDILEANGYDAIESRDGLNVVAIVKDQRPDLVLMDIQLPNVSGIDIITELKADDALKAIPVIAVTAFAMQEDEDRILASGCESYIAKPIDISQLVETINQHIN